MGDHNVVFKSENDTVEAIKIDSKIYSPLTRKKNDWECFFTDEGKIDGDFFKPLGSHILELIKPKGNYKSPWDPGIGYFEEDLFDLTFSHYRAAEKLYQHPLTFFSG